MLVNSKLMVLLSHSISVIIALCGYLLHLTASARLSVIICTRCKTRDMAQEEKEQKRVIRA